MTYRGHVKNGQITLDESTRLPEGVEVNIEVVENGNGKTSNSHYEELSAVLLRHAGKGCGIPPDLATHHDHYAHGKPRS